MSILEILQTNGSTDLMDLVMVNSDRSDWLHLSTSFYALIQKMRRTRGSPCLPFPVKDQRIPLMEAAAKLQMSLLTAPPIQVSTLVGKLLFIRYVGKDSRARCIDAFKTSSLSSLLETGVEAIGSSHASAFPFLVSFE